MANHVGFGGKSSLGFNATCVVRNLAGCQSIQKGAGEICLPSTRLGAYWGLDAQRKVDLSWVTRLMHDNPDSLKVCAIGKGQKNNQQHSSTFRVKYSELSTPLPWTVIPRPPHLQVSYSGLVWIFIEYEWGMYICLSTGIARSVPKCFC